MFSFRSISAIPALSWQAVIAAVLLQAIPQFRVVKVNNKELFHNALLQQALSLHRSGGFDLAINIYRDLLKFFPRDAQLLYLLGTAESNRGNSLEAVKLLEKSLKIFPSNADAHFNRGNALKELKRFNEALQSYSRAIQINPCDADAYINRGNILLSLRRFEDALFNFEQAIRLRPSDPDAHNNRGISLKELKRFDDALLSFDCAIQLKGDYAEAYNNRGDVLRELGRFDEALESICNAIKIDENCADAYCGRGNVLQCLRRFDEALNSFDQAIRLSSYPTAYWNKSLLLLLLGDYREGWELYEWRWKSAFLQSSSRNFKEPLWLGQEPIAGKTVLIYAEQGMGDIIQFSRYLPMVESLGAKVVFEVPESLKLLFATLECKCTIIEKGRRLPDFDVHCPIMSLPLAFKTTLDTIPSKIPYVHADIDKQIAWKRKLGNKLKPRVGLAWSGSVQHGNDGRRSIGLELLSPLLKLPYEFHSLQKEYREKDKASMDALAALRDHHDELSSFADTAALIMEMDVVVSVDTSIAHLAAALGKNVLILLPFFPDFRWLLDRQDSPWYPTVTLIRQTAIGDWKGAIDEVVEKLRDALEQQS